MYVFNRLSIQSKLMVMLLLVSVTSIAAISWIAYSSGKDALTTEAFNHLTGVRSSRKIQIELFFKNLRSTVSNLANDRMIVSATREFTAGLDKLKTVQMRPEWDAKLTAYYKDRYLPELAKATGQTPRFDAFYPVAPWTRYMQYMYIVDNPYSRNDRYKFNDAGDGSEYSATHARYEAILAKYIVDFGYDNMMLFDTEGNMIWGNSKAEMFGTNLIMGPCAGTPFDELFLRVRKSMYSGDVQVVDFFTSPYAMGKPIALMGAPVLDGGKEIGVLLLQFPIDEIQRVMTENFGWEKEGLGKTGEAYLAGPDMLLRSASRLHHEDPERYFKEMAKAGYPPSTIEAVRRAGTVILTQPARTKAVESALAGQSGTAILTNYRGVPALTSYAPLDIPGLRWVVVAEMEASEAFAPLADLTRGILIWSIVLVLVVTLVAGVLGRRFVQPIFQLVDGVRRLRSGERDVKIKVDTYDEFADLAGAFNHMSDSICKMTDQLERTTRERDGMVDNLLPEPAATRVKQGRDPQLDTYTEISVLHAMLRNSAEASGAIPSDRELRLLNDLVMVIDDAADQRGVDKLSCNAALYVAACGMSRQRLDHASRTVDFAQDILKVVARFNRDRQCDFTVQIGIDSGPATGGVLGKTRVTYHLSGETRAISRILAELAPAGSVLVSQRFHAAIQNLYLFGAETDLTLPGGGVLAAWPLTPPGRDPEIGKGRAAAEGASYA